MSDKRDWVDYVDLASKVLLPVVILIATFFFNASEDARKATEENKQQTNARTETVSENQDRDRQSCIDLEIKLVSVSCEGASCAAMPQRNGEVLTIAQLLHTMCTGVGLQLSAPVKTDVLDASKASHDVGASVAGQEAVGQPLPTLTPVPASASPVLSQGLKQAPAAPGQARVYIEYADKAQEPAANALHDRLSAAVFRGQHVVAPPVQHVAAAPSQTVLRCFKKADCAVAQELASYISGQIGASVAVRDFAQRFGNDPTVRPGNFEFWFGPGTFHVVGTGHGS